jgi:hypothetical protein
VQLHHDLLPLDELDLGADSVLARIRPYRAVVQPGGTLAMTVDLRNPLPTSAAVELVPVLPDGWWAQPVAALELAPGARGSLPLVVSVATGPGQRFRVAVDVTVGSLRLGQHAEALVDIADPGAGSLGPLPGKGAA